MMHPITLLWILLILGIYTRSLMRLYDSPPKVIEPHHMVYITPIDRAPLETYLAMQRNRTESLVIGTEPPMRRSHTHIVTIHVRSSKRPTRRCAGDCSLPTLPPS